MVQFAKILVFLLLAPFIFPSPLRSALQTISYTCQMAPDLVSFVVCSIPIDRALRPPGPLPDYQVHPNLCAGHYLPLPYAYVYFVSTVCLC